MIYLSQKFIYCLHGGGYYYIGSTVRGYSRFISHYQYLIRGAGHNPFLQRVFNKYDLEVVILHVLPQYFTDKQVRAVEQIYLDSCVGLTKCINISNSAYSPPVLRGIFHPCYGKSGLGSPGFFRGKTHSEVTKKLMSFKLKGKKAWNKGIPMRAESKEKLRLHNLGKEPGNKNTGKVYLWENKLDERIEVSAPELARLYCISDNKLQEVAAFKPGHLSHKGWKCLACIL